MQVLKLEVSKKNCPYCPSFFFFRHSLVLLFFFSISFNIFFSCDFILSIGMYFFSVFVCFFFTFFTDQLLIFCLFLFWLSFYICNS